MSKYTGTYQSSINVQIVIGQSDASGLTLRDSTQFFKLLPLADGQFTIAGSEDRFRLIFFDQAPQRLGIPLIIGLFLSELVF